MTLFEQFYNEQNGKGIDTDGYGYQCVSLFKWWLKKLGDPNWKRALGGSGYAKEIYYRFYELGYDKYFDLVWDDAKVGDVLVYGETNETPYSHVSFFMGDLPNGKQHYSWGQNQSSDMKACTITLSNSGLIAVLRAKNQTATGTTTQKPTVTQTVAGFEDVDANAYYANAVVWAKEAGIIKGKTDSIFDPDSPCTRGEIVLMLQRYDNYLNGVRETTKTNTLTFPCEGIDISEHNGDIDLTPYKNGFVIIRGGYWNVEDKYFKTNVAKCEKLGIPYGVYWYGYALDTEQAVTEAQTCISLLKTCNPTFGVWYDVEPDNWKMQNEPNWATGYPTKEYLYPIVDKFCKTLEQAGYQDIGIYAGNGFYDKVPPQYPTWYPHYGTNNGTRQNDYKNVCYIHQYTSNPIDKNYAYANPFPKK